MGSKIMPSTLFFVTIAFTQLSSAQGQPVPLGRSNGRSGFKAEFRATLQIGTGEPREIFREFRFVSSNRDWRSIQQHSSGKIVERIFTAGRGEFQVDREQKKLFRLANQRSEAISQDAARFAGRVVRAEQLLGFNIDVYEVHQAGELIHYYRAKELGGGVIKLVRRNDKHTFILEATRVVGEEPAPELMALPEYPVHDAPKRIP